MISSTTTSWCTLGRTCSTLCSPPSPGSSPPSSTPSTARPTTPFQDSSEHSPSQRRLTRFLTRSGITRRGKEYEGFHRGSQDRRPQMTEKTNLDDRRGRGESESIQAVNRAAADGHGHS